MVDTVFSDEDTAEVESAEEDGEGSVIVSGYDKSKHGFRSRRPTKSRKRRRSAANCGELEGNRVGL